MTTPEFLDDCVQECIAKSNCNAYDVIPFGDMVYCILIKANVTKSDAIAYVPLNDEESICGLITRLYEPN